MQYGKKDAQLHKHMLENPQPSLEDASVSKRTMLGQLIQGLFFLVEGGKLWAKIKLAWGIPMA